MILTGGNLGRAGLLIGGQMQRGRVSAGGGGGGAIALIASSSAAGGANSATSGNLDSTGANLLIAAVASYAGTADAGTMSDSRGNTWTALTSYAAGNCRIRSFWSKPTSVGASHNATYSLTSGFLSIAFAAFSGANASPFDTQNGATGSGTSKQPGSITPAGDNELIVSALCFDTLTSTASLAIDSGMTILEKVPYSSGTCLGVALAYQIQTAATAINPTWSWTGTISVAANIASFKP